MKHLSFLMATLFVAVVMISCGLEQKTSERTYNNRQMTITADEAFKPMLDQLTKTFMATTEGKEIKVVYRPEEEAINLMLRDSARLVFTTRELREEEKKVFKSFGATYKLYPIATDGVALITHRSNKDTLMTVDELRGIFEGKIRNWGQLTEGNLKAKITLVFDNANATNLRYVMKRLGVSDVKQINIYAAGSNEKVIEYVRQNPNTLGFIGVNWISDGESLLSVKLSQGLNVLGLSEKSNAPKSEYYQPFQRDIGLKRYPFYRDVFIISTDSKGGLGSDFINYIIRDVGKLIIEKCGLWPDKPANREVIINTTL